MGQNPSRDGNSQSASQEVSLLLWKLQVRYYIHKGQS